MQFRERSQENFAKFRRFFAQSLKRTKKFHSLKLCFPQKIVFGFIECKIGKHAKTIMPTIQKLLLQVRKKWKKETLFEKDFFYKTIFWDFWDDRMQFWQTRIFSEKVWEWQGGSLNFRKISEK